MSSNHTDAGKTGTTDDYADAWFSGYTPRLMATVWIGYPTGKIPMLSVHGITVSGPTFPAEIWHLYMDDGDRQATRRSVPARANAAGVGLVARPVGVLRLVHELDDNGHDTTTATTRAQATTAPTTAPAPTTVCRRRLRLCRPRRRWSSRLPPPTTAAATTIAP